MQKLIHGKPPSMEKYLTDEQKKNTSEIYEIKLQGTRTPNGLSSSTVKQIVSGGETINDEVKGVNHGE